jgi:short-subunit dehydrogenase
MVMTALLRDEEERLDALQSELENKFNVAIYTLSFDVRDKAR